MSVLANETCESCENATGKLDAGGIRELRQQLHPNWAISGEHHLERQFQFKDFRQALEFTNKVGDLAETQGHHPDILVGWGKVVITLCTHSVDGLTRADFVMAARIDQI